MRRGPAWCWDKWGVKGNQHEAELNVVPALLKVLPLRGNVVTGDALYCQRELCRQVVEAGGDYLFTVKGNQPTLLADVVTLFREPPVGEAFGWAEQRSRHGDREEVRRLWASSALTGYSDWPHLGQVCRVEREVQRHGQVRREEAYLVTSLDLAQASPRQLLAMNRGHWGIENRLHWVRDVTMGEDASQVRSGSVPQVLAALRSAVIGVFRQRGEQNIAAALRECGWRPQRALHLLGLLPPP